MSIIAVIRRLSIVVSVILLIGPVPYFIGRIMKDYILYKHGEYHQLDGAMEIYCGGLVVTIILFLLIILGRATFLWIIFGKVKRWL